MDTNIEAIKQVADTFKYLADSLQITTRELYPYFTKSAFIQGWISLILGFITLFLGLFFIKKHWGPSHENDPDWESWDVHKFFVILGYILLLVFAIYVLSQLGTDISTILVPEKEGIIQLLRAVGVHNY